ncbi:DUF2971 domain-containing protein [Uliginosibacterium gangwonense]|uniref:DUF2971 domain-containing protein n=1 Tax=Uliginosibacterium gangwonense TaxID=392736 RepID=UPI000364C242|nr:DUF2971 domain-containing protein [Uliginosibacterium gangwonense]
MANNQQPPKLLYKYRGFSNLTLSLLVDDTIYFATPTTFNDPLDTRPSLEADIDNEALEKILSKLIEERTSAEMSAAAKAIRYRGPKTLDHIDRQSRKTAERLLADIRYDATNPDFEVDEPVRFLLNRYIEDELLRRYDKGVFSLAARATCPLMWSHYADQHRGLCLGYSIPEAAMPNIHKIQYGGNRVVLASVVEGMLSGNDTARRAVDNAVLLKKAKPWAYEREWRLIGPLGKQDSPLELEEVVFGMRCDSAVKYAVVRALEKRERPVRFFEIREQRSSFILLKRRVDIDELASALPRRCRAFDGIFDDLSEPVPPDQGAN